MTCECGCGWEGEDEVAQYLVEEALMTALELDEARIEAEAIAETQGGGDPVKRSVSRRDQVLQRMGATQA